MSTSRTAVCSFSGLALVGPAAETLLSQASGQSSQKTSRVTAQLNKPAAEPFGNSGSLLWGSTSSKPLRICAMLGYRIANRPARLPLLLSALLLSSCVQSKSPLSDPDKAKSDERLIGAWSLSEKGPNGPQYTLFFIGKSGHRGAPSGIMKMVQIDIDRENNVKTKEPLYFFTTSVGNRSYANLFEGAVFDRAKFPPWDKRNIQEYVLIKYEVEGDKLTVWLGNPKAAEAAVRKGQVKGLVQETGRFIKLKHVTLTDAEGLSRFLANGGDKVLFPDDGKSVFSRVK